MRPDDLGATAAMKPIPGPPPVGISQLQRAQDRLSFLYVERCVVHRDSNALTVTDERGVVHVPAATIGALLLGPGTNVTHQAMVLVAESGATCVWVGEQGVRYYAHGRTLTNSSRLLEAQATLVSNQSSRLRVAREMYAMRFPGEDVSGLTMQQLRGREGARVRQAYRDAAQEYGVEWKRRDYRPDDFAGSDPINMALSAATTSLYGVCHAVIVALGCAAGLGFVHTGHARSFVFDVADLYKAEVAIPAAFKVAGEHDLEDIPAETRRLVRDLIVERDLLVRCARDVRRLLTDSETDAIEDAPDWDVIYLWDRKGNRVVGGQNHSDEAPW
ncbi:type I-E CRISPR-associated endonuclease Cas1e [Nostocoides veronense]|uniref:CRISPR-associated endonuclease Cas1 n=1 Tax=Nostocoides veronense TaxID=330836 RepID=A0ABN2LMX3_9MICO